MSGVSAVLRAAARLYAPCGRGVVWSVRSKLTLDPVYAALVDRGIGEAGRVVDLGCGRGLALAVARAARGTGPPASLVGIERAARPLRIARRALGATATLVEGDLAGARVPEADLVLLLDVLHYLDEKAQNRVLDAARSALATGGRIVVREADAGTGAGFQAVRFSERLMAWTRGEGSLPFTYRAAAGWTSALADRGFTVETTPMGTGTPFANVLLVGRASS